MYICKSESNLLWAKFNYLYQIFYSELHTFTKLYLEYKIMKNSNDFSYIIYFQ